MKICEKQQNKNGKSLGRVENICIKFIDKLF
jgi:hypothetical protein